MAKRKRRIVDSLAAVAKALGVRERIVSRWIADGMPRRAQPGKPHRFFYDLDSIEAWKQEREPAAVVDPLLAGPASPALEEYRRARAGLATLELEQRRGNLIDRGLVHERMMRAAMPLRRAGETLQRKFGPEAQQVLDDAVDEFLREIGVLGGSGNGNGGPDSDSTD